MNESYAKFEAFKDTTDAMILKEVGTEYSKENTRKVRAIIDREAKASGYAPAALSCRHTLEGWRVV